MAVSIVRICDRKLKQFSDSVLLKSLAAPKSIKKGKGKRKFIKVGGRWFNLRTLKITE